MSNELLPFMVGQFAITFTLLSVKDLILLLQDNALGMRMQCSTHCLRSRVLIPFHRKSKGFSHPFLTD
jgi:hypothetical protein